MKAVADNTSREKWHTLPIDSVFDRLGSSLNGLDPDVAHERLAAVGPNAISVAKGVSPAGRFLAQFRSPLIYILLLASVISFALGEHIDGGVILFIVLFNAIIGFVQEYKAERALQALRELSAPTAEVVRGGEELQIPTERVVPGDIFLLEAGDRVPADGRLVEAARMKVEEAALTGESVPVDKSVEALPESTPLAEMRNMVFAGTTVASGRGQAVVTETGDRTRTGLIAREVQASPESETPIQRKLAQVGKWLGVVGLLVAGLLVIVGLLRGFDIYTLFFTAVAAAVSFIPEGLPAIVTVVLAVGVQRMAKRHAIIRKLPAVEALGSATVICTDKTGTLTKNEMTVQVCHTADSEYQVTGEGYAPVGELMKDGTEVQPDQASDLSLLILVGSLCSDAHLVEQDGRWSIIGDPTEGAIRVVARKIGLRRATLEEEYPRIDEIPFESESRYMATLNRSVSGRSMVCVKGAPERVLGMCSRVRINGNDLPLSTKELSRMEETNRSMAGKAYRVLAVAYKDVPGEVDSIGPEDAESDLVFLGMFGILDPPRPEVAVAVADAKRAGIRVMMITGDNPTTAQAIAEALGILDGGEVVTGHQLDEISDEELEQRIRTITVFARVEPQHKHRIVDALKRNGELVAMTGDGVNDAPALKLADIGISMGITGTDVARESSDMVLADDNFATIIAAVEEGRVIFANLRKVVQYLLATNTGEILTFITAIIAGFPLPLLPVQILWVNLVTDGFATAPLSVEPEEGDVLREPPRNPREPVLTRRQIGRIAMVAIIMTLGTLVLFHIELERGGLLKARTMAFATLAIFQLFNTFNARSSTQSVFRIGLMSNPYILYGVGAALVLQILVITVPALHGIFGTTALSLAEWGLVALTSSTVLVAEEIRKSIAPDLFHDQPSPRRTG